MTTAAARPGGETKFVPWKTSHGPASSSTGGTSARDHAARSTRAGTRTGERRVPGRSGSRPRSENATSRSDSPSSGARAASAPTSSRQ